MPLSNFPNGLTSFGYQVLTNADFVSGISAVPENLVSSITDYTITEDITSYLQDVIDGFGDSGGCLYLNNGRWPVAGLRLDGSNGDKTNVQLFGSGWGTHIRKPDDSALTTVDKKRCSVIFTEGGSGFVIQNLWVEGNASRGGTKPPFGIRWTTSTSYPYPYSATLSTKADGTEGTNSELYLSLGARMFLVLKAHTSDATNILNDVAAGNVVEVTNVWNELTETGYYPSGDTDSDYAYRHVICLHGQDDYVTDCLLINVKATDQVYGSFLLGSGPLYQPAAGYGAKRCTTINCFASGSFGGGLNTFCTHIAPRTSGGTSSGIRLDEGSHDSTIIAPLVEDGGSLVNGGVNLYKSYRCKVIAPRVRDTSLAIWIQECVDYDLIAPDVDGNTIAINSSTPIDHGFEHAQLAIADADGRTLTAGMSGSVFTNTGATAIAVFTLPVATNGLEFTFIVMDSDGIRVVPAGDDTIRIGTSVSGVGSLGKIEATALGSTIKLRCLSFTAWVAEHYTPSTWTVT